MNSIPDWLYIAMFFIGFFSWLVVVLNGIYQLGLMLIRLWKGHRHD
jgi:hypothetical protein